MRKRQPAQEWRICSQQIETILRYYIRSETYWMGLSHEGKFPKCDSLVLYLHRFMKEVYTEYPDMVRSFVIQLYIIIFGEIMEYPYPVVANRNFRLRLSVLFLNISMFFSKNLLRYRIICGMMNSSKFNLKGDKLC